MLVQSDIDTDQNDSEQVAVAFTSMADNVYGQQNNRIRARFKNGQIHRSLLSTAKAQKQCTFTKTGRVGHCFRKVSSQAHAFAGHPTGIVLDFTDARGYPSFMPPAPK